MCIVILFEREREKASDNTCHLKGQKTVVLCSSQAESRQTETGFITSSAVMEWFCYNSQIEAAPLSPRGTPTVCHMLIKTNLIKTTKYNSNSNKTSQLTHTDSNVKINKIS